jgi:F0F1-type ATP synthase membrane subunit b/b'
MAITTRTDGRQAISRDLDTADEAVEELQKLVREQQRQIADLTQQREIFQKTLGIVCEGPSNGTSGSKK